MLITIIISTFAPLKPETIRAVDYLKQFVIPFVGLSAGNHQFEFEIDDKFFASFEYSEIKKARVTVSLDLNKQERMLVLNFSLSGTLQVRCDRCLDEFDMPVESFEEYFIKFGLEHREEDDNILVIAENETHIDVAQLIFDYLSLSVPYRVVHPDDENGVSQCNPEVIKKIEELSARKENESQWDALKNLNLE
ncbi:MAG: DUF177 domain-containing protein [Lentimicrobium sp.]|nr:DUF177 domain-containing protein [Lentimicrobium sp.]